MSKRKLSINEPFSSKQLNLYKKSYKGGATKDLHLPVFQDALRWITASATDATSRNSSITKVLYPGCHRHLTAALVFADVTFVDYDTKVGPLFSDPVAREYVETHKLYDEDSHYQFYCYNVNSKMPEIHKGKYDLLISLSSGAMVEPCTPYIKSSKNKTSNGYLLVNDAHSDARTAFVSNKWQLLAYWDDDTHQFATDRLEECFRVIVRDDADDDNRNSNKKKSPTKTSKANTKPITKDQVQESIAVGTVRKRSFQLLFEPMFFLFQKKGMMLDTNSSTVFWQPD